jgi:hypothetical protein
MTTMSTRDTPIRPILGAIGQSLVESAGLGVIL